MEPEIIIYDNNGDEFLTVTIGEGSERVFKLMEDDYVELHFSTDGVVELKLGYYIEVSGEKFTITDPVLAAYNEETGGYDYEQVFEAEYRKWKNKIFRFQSTANSTCESSWTLTGTLDTFMDVFLKNLSTWSYTYNGSDYSYAIDEDLLTTNYTISFEAASLLDALSQIAEEVDCDWWVSSGVIHLGRCEHNDGGFTGGSGGNAYELVNAENCTMEFDESEDDYYTRIYAFGSDKNIGTYYRQSVTFTVTKNTGSAFIDSDKPLSLNYFMSSTLQQFETTYHDEDTWGYASRNITETADEDDEYAAEYGSYTCEDIEYTIFPAGELITGTSYTLSFEDAVFHVNQQGCTYIAKVYYGDSYLLGTVYEGDGSEATEIYNSTFAVLSLEELTFAGRADDDITLRISIYSQTPIEQSSGEASQTAYKTLFNGDVIIRSVNKCAVTTATNADGETATVTFNPTYLVSSMADGYLYSDDADKFPVGTEFTLKKLEYDNLPNDFFDNELMGWMSLGVVNNALMLPESTPYIDLYDDMAEDEIIEGVVTFDDIYPRRVSTVEEISTETVALEDSTTGEDSDYTYTQYTITCSDWEDFDEEYIVDTLAVTFQTGLLAGLTFEVEWQGDGKFTLVANEDYGGTLLPNDVTLYPAVDDTFILSGYDASYIDESMVTEAEEELLERAQEYAEQMRNQVGTVTATLYCDKAKEILDAKGSDAIEAFTPGQRIYIDDRGLCREALNMRVIGYTIPLDYPYDNPEYEIGESAAYTRLNALEQAVESQGVTGSVNVVTSSLSSSGSSSSSSGSSVEIIKTGDSTAATDANVYSALRTNDEIDEAITENNAVLAKKYLSKITDDTAAGEIAFNAGWTVGADEEGSMDEEGNLVAETVQVKDEMTTPDAVKGTAGGGLYGYLEDGNFHLETDVLLVRKLATFVELEIQKLTHVGGQIILTPASMTCCEVETNSDGNYVCYFESTDGDATVDNDFAENDLARCQTFNLTEYTGEDGTTVTQNKYYWRKVIEVGTDEDSGRHYIVLSATDCDEACASGDAGIPAKGDEIVQLGNSEDEDRQKAIILASYGDGSPYIIMYRGIDTYDLTAATVVAKLSPDEVTLIADSLTLSTGKTVEEYVEDEISNIDISDAYRLVLTTYAKTYVADSDGNVTIDSSTVLSYSAVYCGTTIVGGRSSSGSAVTTNGWTFTIACDGCEATIGSGTGIIYLTSFESDSATITVTATNSDSSLPTLTATISLAKAVAGVDGADGADGADGTSPYTLVLTTYAKTYVADSDGNVEIDSDEVISYAAVYCGTTLVGGTGGTTNTANGWTFSLSCDGCEGATTTYSGWITLISFELDSAIITVTATNSDSSLPTLTATISLAKTLSGENGTDGADGEDGEDGEDGADGADAVVYSIEVSSPTMSINWEGEQVTPQKLSATRYKTVGEERSETTDKRFRYVINWDDEDNSTEETYVSTASVTITGADDLIQTDSNGDKTFAESIDFYFEEEDGTTLAYTNVAVLNDFYNTYTAVESNLIINEDKIAAIVQQTTYVYTMDNETATGTVEVIVEQIISSLSLAVGNIESLVEQVEGIESDYSSITQTIDEIELKVGTTYSENLFPDGSFKHNTDDGDPLCGYYASNCTVTMTSIDDIEDDSETVNVMKVTPSSSSPIVYLCLGDAGCLPVVKGNTYTVMFRVAGTSSSTATCTYYISDTAEYSSESTTSIGSSAYVADSWTWVSGVVEAESSGYMILRIRTARSSSVTAYLKDFMVFEGDYSDNLPTEYIDNETQNSLLATGICINAGKVVITGDSFIVQNNEGEETLTVDEDGVVHMTVCEVSGFIRTEPRIVGDDYDWDSSVDGDDTGADMGDNPQYMNIVIEDLYKGAFVYFACSANSAVANRALLPTHPKYAGAHVTLMIRGTSVYLYVSTRHERIDETEYDDDGNTYDGWVKDDSYNAIRCAGTSVNYIKFKGGKANRYVELLAVPYVDDDDNGDGTVARGQVEWVVLNSGDFDIEDDGSVDYALCNLTS